MHMKETEHLEEERGSPMSTEMASPPRQPKPEPMQCFTSVMRNTVKGMENNITLWQFLLELLLSHQHNDKIQWTNNEGEFKLINAEEVAKLWGMRKNKANMNYDKLSRALRYYYDKNIIKKVMGQKFVYKFVSFPEVVKTENKIPFKVKMESLSQGFGVRSTPCVSSFKPYEPKYSSPSSQSSHAHSAVIAADSPASVESHWAQTGQTIAHTIPLHSVPMHADTVFALPHSQPLPVKLENVKMEHPPQHSTPSPVPPVEIRVCDSPVSVRSRSVSPAPPSHRGSPAPARESPAPHRVSPAPPRTSPAPSRTSPAPERYSPAPQRYSPAPQRYSPGPSRYSPGPSRYSPGPLRYSPPSQRYSPAPQRYAPATHRVSPAPSSSRANPGISVSPAPPVSESEQTVNVSPSGSGGRPKPYPLSLEPSVLSPMPIPSPKVPLESLTAASFSQFTGRLPGSLSAMPTPTIFLASPVVGGGAQRTPMMPLHFWSSLSPLATLSPRLSATSAQHFQFPSLSGADGRYSLSPAINVPHFTGFNDLQSPVFVTSPTKKNIPVP